MNQYIIISNSRVADTAREVNEYLKQGYVLAGPLAVSIAVAKDGYSSMDKAVYAQPMMLKESQS